MLDLGWGNDRKLTNTSSRGRQGPTITYARPRLRKWQKVGKYLQPRMPRHQDAAGDGPWGCSSASSAAHPGCPSSAEGSGWPAPLVLPSALGCEHNTFRIKKLYAHFIFSSFCFYFFHTLLTFALATAKSKEESNIISLSFLFFFKHMTDTWATTHRLLMFALVIATGDCYWWLPRAKERESVM